MLDYLYIAATIVFTVYGQLILKWRVGFYGEMPVNSIEKLKFVLGILLDPWVISGLTAAFLASFAWIAAMSKFELVHAYPFMSLNFVFVFLLSGLLLNEPISLQRALGLALIILGTVVAARV
jgi:multidrug transporter EmrE-like cation transporter